MPNPDLTIDEGAIAPWAGARGEYFHRVLTAVAETYGFRTTTPWKKLKKAEQKVLLYGSGTKQVHVQYRNRYGRTRSYYTHYEGVVPYLQRRHSEAESDYIARADRGLHAGGAVPRRAAAPASSPSRWASPSTAATSTRCATCRSPRRPRSCPASSSPSATA